MTGRFIQPEKLVSYDRAITSSQLAKALDLTFQEDDFNFLQYWYSEFFIINFDWGRWQEGREFLNQEYPPFHQLDEVFCYKLITAIIRNDRFNEGALQVNLENGNIRKIIERLMQLKSLQSSERFRYQRKPRKCPVCKSNQIATYLYGMPALYEIEEELSQGKIVLGGCCISNDDPAWQCQMCKTDLFKKLNKPNI